MKGTSDLILFLRRPRELEKPRNANQPGGGDCITSQKTQYISVAKVDGVIIVAVYSENFTKSIYIHVEGGKGKVGYQ